MSRKEWQKVKEIFEDAIELDEDARRSYLEKACAGDPDLRHSVENLLDSFNHTGIEDESVSSHPPADSGSIVEVGEEIGRFEIIKDLATGGMGEVYLAKDIRLDRKVAIKFLRKEFSQALDPLHRFEREAKSASALNHPNIITIYEVGNWKNADFIAMEFVEGESVRQLLNERKLDLDEALNIAIQVASALSAAHAAGIIHRDIKPENLMRRPDGLIKVLDFGLAKQTIEVLEEVDSNAVTRRVNSTIPGMIMGTVAYMSPEQARGRKTDARTDIWSLGVVLYEMIAGRPPFAGETKSDILVAILKGEPEPLPASGSEAIEELNRILKKALTKDKDERYQSIKDLLVDLKIVRNELSSSDQKTELLLFTTREEKAMQTDPAVSAKSETLAPKRSFMWPLIPVALLVAIFGFWYLWQRQTATDPNILSSLSTSQITSWKSELGEGDAGRPKLSPDGKIIAFVANKNGHPSIWLKQLGGGEAFTRKQDESDDTSPVWSPDGNQIAYISNRGGSRGIWAAPALGGAPTLIAPIDTRADLVEWAKDGATIYVEAKRNLYSLTVADGQIKKLTNFDETKLSSHAFNISPDGAHLAYTDREGKQSDIWISDLDGSNPKRVTNDPADDDDPIWLPDGKRIVYNSDRNGTKQICLAYANGREPQQLSLSDSDNVLSDISADGTKLVYATTKDDSDIWSASTETGKESQVSSDIGVEFWPDVSPDGNTIAYQAIKRISIGDKLLNSELIAQQIGGEGRDVQLSNDGFNPQWSPDGKKIGFLRSQSGNIFLWIVSGTGGDSRRLTENQVLFGGYSQLPYNRLQTQDFQWSPDSSSLIYIAVRSGIPNVFQVAADGSGEKQLTNNQDVQTLYFNPLFSPDGKSVVWLAMNFSNPKERSWHIWMSTNGNANEIYKSDAALRLVGWTSTGRELIVKSVESKQELSSSPLDVKLFKIPIAGGEPQPLMTLKSAYFNNIRLSPDRRSIAYVSRPATNDTIQIIGPADKTPRTVIESNDPRVYFSSLAFSPDGKNVFYGKQANWRVITMVNNFK